PAFPAISGRLVSGLAAGVSGPLVGRDRPVWARTDGGRMATTTHIQKRDALRRAAGSVLLVAALLSLIWFAVRAARPLSGAATAASETKELDGRDERQPPTNRPTVEAAFPRESYAPGSVARLVIWTSGASVSLQV